MNRDQKIYRLAYWIAAFIIAAVLFSGFRKIVDPEDFALAVYRFHLLPGCMVNGAALYFPWLEMVCAFCLLFRPKYRVAALWIALALLLVFTGGIVINLLRGSAFSCGCFGRSATAKPMDWLSVARNIALILLIVLALYGRKKSEV